MCKLQGYDYDQFFWSKPNLYGSSHGGGLRVPHVAEKIVVIYVQNNKQPESKTVMTKQEIRKMNWALFNLREEYVRLHDFSVHVKSVAR